MSDRRGEPADGDDVPLPRELNRSALYGRDVYRTGHAGAALVAYSPVGSLTLALGFRTLSLYGALGALALCMLPDIDHGLPGVDHRGPTHTVWFLLAVAVLCGIGGAVIASPSGIAAAAGLGLFGFAVGALTIGSHIAADVLTPMGIRPFAPYDTRHYTLDVTKAANPVANFTLLAVGGLTAALAFRVATAVAAL